MARLYFLLAAFDVLTVCVGLYFSHSMTKIYVEAVAVNQTWARRVAEFSRLGELAAAVNAPGNDVFDSYNVGNELKRMNTAMAAFEHQFSKVRRELQSSLPPAEAKPLVQKLDAVGHAMGRMTGDARLIFAHLRADQPIAAGARMATMDRRHGKVREALGELRAHAAASQQGSFERQAAAAARQERYEYLIGVLVLLMVAGATFYGHRLARQAETDAAERERHLLALSHAKSELESSDQQKRKALLALEETHARLQALFKRSLEAEERQRQHLARELHEDVSQMLASLKMRLGALDPAPGIGRHLKDAGSLAESAIHRLQDLVRDLTPHGMEIVGLAGVLPAHVEEWARGSGLAVHFTERLRARPPFRIESAAYRVAQEAVANAARHAQASTLHVELRSTARELQLRVADDGTGFDPQAARRYASLGITLMEQRIAALGGRLEIRSTPGSGTTVLAAFPLQQQLDWVSAG